MLPRTKKQVIWTKGFFFWNPETKQVALYSFGMKGTIRHHTYRKEGQSWISEGWVLGRKKGEKLPRKTRIEVKDDGNTHIHHRTVEGEPEKTQIWKRTSGAEE